MNPQEFQPVSPVSRDPLASAEPGAQLVCEIKRHPIGIVGMYLGAAFLLIVLTIVIYGIVPSVLTGYSRGQIASIGSLVIVVAALVVTGFVLIAHVIYWGNRWIVTNETITQIVKTGLFNKQTSQLSLNDLQDLTVEQNGPLAQMFNYGVISAETAAATDKFFFAYCPKPTEYARQILAARDHLEQARQNPAPPPPPSTETGYRVPD